MTYPGRPAGEAAPAPAEDLTPLDPRISIHAPVEGNPSIRECQRLIGPREAVYLPVTSMAPAMQLTNTIDVEDGVTAYIMPVSLHPQYIGQSNVPTAEQVAGHLKELRDAGVMIVRQTVALGDGRRLPAAYTVGLQANEEALDSSLKGPVTDVRDAVTALERFRLSQPSVVMGPSDQMTSTNPEGGCITYPVSVVGDGYRITALVGSHERNTTELAPCTEEMNPQTVAARVAGSVLGWLVTNGRGVLVAGHSVGKTDTSRPEDPSSLLVNVYHQEHLLLAEPEDDVRIKLYEPPRARKEIYRRLPPPAAVPMPMIQRTMAPAAPAVGPSYPASAPGPRPQVARPDLRPVPSAAEADDDPEEEGLRIPDDLLG